MIGHASGKSDVYMRHFFTPAKLTPMRRLMTLWAIEGCSRFASRPARTAKTAAPGCAATGG